MAGNHATNIVFTCLIGSPRSEKLKIAAAGFDFIYQFNMVFENEIKLFQIVSISSSATTVYSSLRNFNV